MTLENTPEVPSGGKLPIQEKIIDKNILIW